MCVCVCSCCRVAVQAYHECILVLSERKWDFEMSEKPRCQLALCAWLQCYSWSAKGESSSALLQTHHVASFKEHYSGFFFLSFCCFNLESKPPLNFITSYLWIQSLVQLVCFAIVKLLRLFFLFGLRCWLKGPVHPNHARYKPLILLIFWNVNTSGATLLIETDGDVTFFKGNILLKHCGLPLKIFIIIANLSNI